MTILNCISRVQLLLFVIRYPNGRRSPQYLVVFDE